MVAFALGNLQERAQMFVTPGDQVYEGMIAGENSRPGDLDVNVTKEKKLTNMRTTASDDNVILEPPRQITLEYALEYIEEDELIEVTPEEHPAAQAGAHGERPQEGRPGRPGGGRVLMMSGSHFTDGGGHHVGLGDVGGGPRPRDASEVR